MGLLAVNRKLGPAGICGVLINHKGVVLYMFSKNVSIKDSNEAVILAILEALCIYHRSFQYPLVVESDSINAVSWARSFREDLGRCNFTNEIKFLLMGNCISF